MTMMMAEASFQEILEKNQKWAKQCQTYDAELMAKLGEGQSPKILWLGCSDSRVPATSLLGAKPGDVFVHRNIANVLHHSDPSSLAVIEYAVDHLKVEQIIVCGHTHCGGVKAALDHYSVGSVLDGWLMPIRKLRTALKYQLDYMTQDESIKLLTEENVKQGVQSIREMSIVINASNKRDLAVHGVVYDVTTGELSVVPGSEDNWNDVYARLGVYKLDAHP